ncbi:MAG: acyl-CoA dehydrogenase family protein [Acidimicrobiales bacterium]|nr:acyl-CoA dehydrogenase family protein [Acidimicrobiales bacterium]
MTTGSSPIDFGDPAIEAFRAEVRDFFASTLTPERTAAAVDPTDLTGLAEPFEREVLRACGERGWLGISLPAELGGGGRPLRWQAAFSFESAYHDAPTIDTAVTLAAPAVLAHASPAQLERLVPGMLSGDTIAAIAYSEPDAGSDLTRVATTARRSPSGGWIIDGVKAHVTGGHKADWTLLVAVTDPDAAPRDAMSMFVVPLDAPGVTVVRRPTMSGWHLSDLHFDGVEVPDDALLGQENRGWRQMADALLAERSGVFWVGWSARLTDDLTSHLRATGRLVDPRVRRELARLHLGLSVAWGHTSAVLDAQDAGSLDPALAAAAKVAGTELLQEIADAAGRLLGLDALRHAAWFEPTDHRVAARFGHELVDRVRETISVGPNELQRDTIARFALGLPNRPTRCALELAPEGRPAAMRDLLAGPSTLPERIEVARSIGASLVPGPPCSSVLAPWELLHDAAPSPPGGRLGGTLGELLSDLVARLASGDAEVAWAAVVPHTHQAPVVPHADAADYFVFIEAAASPPRAWLAASGDVVVTPVQSLLSDHAATVAFDPAAPGVHELHLVPQALDRAHLVLAGWLLGVAEAALDHAVAHVCTREQHGGPLAALQAVRQQLADRRMDRDALACAARYAADDPNPVAVTRALALATDRAPRITATAHQVCGAEGLYADAPLHRWFRRAAVMARMLGGPDLHLDRLADLLHDERPLP